MKDYRRVITILLLIIVVGAGVTAFFIWKNKAKAPASDTQQISSTSNQRANITCGDIEESGRFIAGTGNQPQNFPQPFGNTIVCGTNIAANTTYYIFDVEKNKLFDYYGAELKKLGYTVEEPTAGLNPEDGSMVFTGQNGDYGDVYWDSTRKMYEITYIAK